MIKLVIIGLWVCAAALGSSYAAANWASGASSVEEEPYLEGLEYRKLELLTIPMVGNGTIQGYVVAKLVYTADAAVLREMSVEPDPFVVDEAFREIYTNGQVEFGKLSKYNLPEMALAIKNNANERLNYEVVQDILLEGLNYIDREEMSRVLKAGPRPEPEEAEAGHEAGQGAASH